MFIFTFILIFRFYEGFPQPFTEPDICVPHQVIAFKFLRNFGHLITNLHLDYNLFFNLKKYPNQYEACKFIEHYLAEYCFESLRKISLQGSSNTGSYIIFKDIERPFINVENVHMEECTFGKELPFNKLFPNLKTLKLGSNIYRETSAIRVQFNSLQNLWFHDKIYQCFEKFDEEDIVEMYKLNPQLEKSMLSLWFAYSPNFIVRLQEYCPNLQLLPYCTYDYHCSFFSFNAFHFKHYFDGRITFTDIMASCPIKISNKYKNALEKLFDFYVRKIR